MGCFIYNKDKSNCLEPWMFEAIHPSEGPLVKSRGHPAMRDLLGKEPLKWLTNAMAATGRNMASEPTGLSTFLPQRRNLKRITEQEARRKWNYTMLLTSTHNVQHRAHLPEISKGIKRTLSWSLLLPRCFQDVCSLWTGLEVCGNTKHPQRKMSWSWSPYLVVFMSFWFFKNMSLPSGMLKELEHVKGWSAQA